MSSPRKRLMALMSTNNPTRVDPDLAYDELPVPWDHQAEDLDMLLRGACALYWEPRLGKTRECGEALRILAAERVVNSVIILCPVNAKHVWGHHLDLFL